MSAHMAVWAPLPIPDSACFEDYAGVQRSRPTMDIVAANLPDILEWLSGRDSIQLKRSVPLAGFLRD